MDQLKINLFSNKYKLSVREKDILTAMVQGQVSAEDIALHFGLSRNTVRIHIKNINSKVGVRSKAAILSEFIRFDNFPVVQVG